MLLIINLFCYLPFFDNLVLFSLPAYQDIHTICICFLFSFLSRLILQSISVTPDFEPMDH